MTSAQTTVVEALLTQLRTPYQWAEVLTTGDDRIVLEWGAIHTGGRHERAIAYYVIEPDGTAVKHVGS